MSSKGSFVGHKVQHNKILTSNNRLQIKCVIEIFAEVSIAKALYTLSLLGYGDLM